jgi:hypothetical protein
VLEPGARRRRDARRVVIAARIREAARAHGEPRRDALDRTRDLGLLALRRQHREERVRQRVRADLHTVFHERPAFLPGRELAGRFVAHAQRAAQFVQPPLHEIGRHAQERQQRGQRPRAARAIPDVEREDPPLDLPARVRRGGVLEQPGQTIPPRRAALLDESGREIERGARTMPLEQGHGPLHVVAITVVERHGHAPPRARAGQPRQPVRNAERREPAGGEQRELRVEHALADAEAVQRALAVRVHAVVAHDDEARPARGLRPMRQAPHPA